MSHMVTIRLRIAAGLGASTSNPIFPACWSAAVGGVTRLLLSTGNRNTHLGRVLCCIAGLGFLIITPVAVQAQSTGINQNQQTTVTQLVQGCAILATATDAAAVDILNTCSLINNTPNGDPALGEILDTVAPEEVFAINDSLVASADYQSSNVTARIATVRARSTSSGTLSLSNHNASQDLAARTGAVHALPHGGAAAAELLTSRLSLFVSGHFADGNTDGKSLQQDTGFNSTNLTLGLDYRISETLVAGVAIGTLQSKTDFSDVGGGIDVTGTNLTLFGSWYPAGGFYLDAVFDFGSNSFDLERFVSLPGQLPVAISGSTDSSTVSFTAGAGKTFNVAKWELGPYARLSVASSTVDSYSESPGSETPGFASIYRFSEQSIDSTRLSIGAQISRAISTATAVVVPQFMVEFETEAEEGKDPVDTVNIRSGWEATLVGTDRDTSYANIGFGASAVFRNGKSAFAHFETLIFQNLITQNQLKLGFRMEF